MQFSWVSFEDKECVWWFRESGEGKPWHYGLRNCIGRFGREGVDKSCVQFLGVSETQDICSLAVNFLDRYIVSGVVWTKNECSGGKRGGGEEEIHAAE
jgi:hypothetical protein